MPPEGDRSGRRSPDLVSLVGGAVVLALGGLLLADQGSTLDLTLGWFGAIAAAAIGAILVASGLGARGD